MDVVSSVMMCVLLMVAALPQAVYPTANVEHISVDGYDNRCEIVVTENPTFEVVTSCKTETKVLNTWFGSHCRNRNNMCESKHRIQIFNDSPLAEYWHCMPKTSNEETVSVTVNGPDCSETVTLRFRNITSCACAYRYTSDTISV